MVSADKRVIVATIACWAPGLLSHILRCLSECLTLIFCSTWWNPCLVTSWFSSSKGCDSVSGERWSLAWVGVSLGSSCTLYWHQLIQFSASCSLLLCVLLDTSVPELLLDSEKHIILLFPCRCLDSANSVLLSWLLVLHTFLLTSLVYSLLCSSILFYLWVYWGSPLPPCLWCLLFKIKFLYYSFSGVLGGSRNKPM